MRSDELVRLLSQRNEPSVLEKEACFETLLDQLDTRRPRIGPRAAYVTAGALAVAAAVALFVSKLTPPNAADSEFASRGAGTQSGPTVRLSCVQGRKESRCTVGATLAFEVGALPSEARYFAAFARSSDGSVLWYFPQGSQPSPALDRSSSGLLEQAIVLGPPHVPGEYQVFLLFAAHPLTQAEIKAKLGPELSSSDGLLVVRRRLLLETEP